MCDKKIIQFCNFIFGFFYQVLIEDGMLISGILCKKILGIFSGFLVYVVFMEYGWVIVGEMYGYIQILVNNWLLLEGYSIGIGDIIVDFQIYIDIQDIIKKVKVIYLKKDVIVFRMKFM